MQCVKYYFGGKRSHLEIKPRRQEGDHHRIYECDDDEWISNGAGMKIPLIVFSEEYTRCICDLHSTTDERPDDVVDDGNVYFNILG